MRKLLIFFLLILAACQAEDATPVVPVNDNFDSTTATRVSGGAFVGTGHSVTGNAILYSDGGKFTVVLEPFSSQNGPDLRVYLSSDTKASSYLNLGVLKSVNGKQSYAIPANTDVSKYPHVLIWCQEFSVLFGHAELK